MRPVVNDDVVEYVRQSFSFLEMEWGYTRTEGYVYSQSVYTRSVLVIIYVNKQIQKQIEIALLVNSDLVEIALTRLTDDGVIVYNDENYCLSYTKLFYLLNPPVFEQITYSYSENDRFKIITNASNIFVSFKNILYSKDWFDVQKIHRLYDAFFEEKWGNNFSSNKKIEPIPDMIRRKLTYLIPRYSLKLDSNLLPFYIRNGWFITYSNGETEITVSQIDMRDYMNYDVAINKIKKTFYYPDYNSGEKLANYISNFIDQHV